MFATPEGPFVMPIDINSTARHEFSRSAALEAVNSQIIRYQIRTKECCVEGSKLYT